MWIVPVPGGDIYPEFQTFVPAGFREFLEDISLAFFPRTLRHGVVADWIRPQAEAVVVLAGDDYPLESGRLGNRSPLAAVEGGWIEYVLGFRPEAPFHPRESVRSEMAEHIHFHLLPGQLLRSRHRSIRLREG